MKKLAKNTAKETLDALVETALQNGSTHGDLPLVKVGEGKTREVYVIARTEKELRDYNVDFVKEILWTFGKDTEMLSKVTGLPAEKLAEVAAIADEEHEFECNNLLEDLIENSCGMDAFVDAAIADEGVESFSPFGNLIEFSCGYKGFHMGTEVV